MAKKPKALAEGTRVFFATNRAPLSDGFDVDAAPGAERRLRLGEAVMERLRDPDLTEAKRLPLKPVLTTGADDFADPARGGCAATLRAWLDAAAEEGAVPLLFIHGFSNTFNDALARAAQLAEFYGAAGARLLPLVFSWPSDGKVVDLGAAPFLVTGAVEQYRRDQADADAAGPALARLLREIQRARETARKGAKPARLALLAHSMGNHALSAGLRALANGLLTAETRDLFDQAVLMAADVPAAVFGRKQPLAQLTDIARQITVGINQDPVLSAISARVNEGPRLGFSGPASLADLPGKVAVVDYFHGMEGDAVKDALIASVPFGGTSFDVVGHQYYRNDRNVRADLAQVLNGADPAAIAERRTLDAAQRLAFGRARTAELVAMV